MLSLRDHAEYQLKAGAYGDYRWPADFRLRRLSVSDVELFFARAVDRLEEIGVRWSVGSSIARDIAEKSAGEPWFLQMIGAQLLSQADRTLLESAGPTGRAVRVDPRSG